tara:strand:+ start:391 stop:708 length:318 start_codon:yes stop_codon:yes gene_type:complete
MSRHNITKVIQVLEHYESRGIPCECAPFIKAAVEIMESHPEFKEDVAKADALLEETVAVAQKAYAKSVDNYSRGDSYKCNVNKQILENAWDARDEFKSRFIFNTK